MAKKPLENNKSLERVNNILSYVVVAWFAISVVVGITLLSTGKLLSILFGILFLTSNVLFYFAKRKINQKVIEMSSKKNILIEQGEYTIGTIISYDTVKVETEKGHSYLEYYPIITYDNKWKEETITVKVDMVNQCPEDYIGSNVDVYYNEQGDIYVDYVITKPMISGEVS